VCTRTLIRKLTAPALLLALHCLPTRAQTTEAALEARLIGQPLFLRGCFMENRLEFKADGQPAKNYRSGTFTEAGMDVRKVKLSHGQLHLEGQRVALEFLDMIPTRVNLQGKISNSSITIDIPTPPGGDFSEALDAIFAPDLAGLVPSMPVYWQEFARKHLLASDAAAAATNPTASASAPSQSDSFSADKPFHVGGSVVRPVVLDQQEPEYSDLARVLKFSGNVEVYLWVLPDGSTGHLRIAKPAGLGLDEQALASVSHYKFKPATKDGKPVTVDLYVDVNFQILR
jgi:TonB family protein